MGRPEGRKARGTSQGRLCGRNDSGRCVSRIRVRLMPCNTAKVTEEAALGLLRAEAEAALGRALQSEFKGGEGERLRR